MLYLLNNVYMIVSECLNNTPTSACYSNGKYKCSYDSAQLCGGYCVSSTDNQSTFICVDSWQLGSKSAAFNQDIPNPDCVNNECICKGHFVSNGQCVPCPISNQYAVLQDTHGQCNCIQGSNFSYGLCSPCLHFSVDGQNLVCVNQCITSQLAVFSQLMINTCVSQNDLENYSIVSVDTQFFVTKFCQTSQNLQEPCVLKDASSICDAGNSISDLGVCGCINSLQTLKYTCSGCAAGQIFIDKCRATIDICEASGLQALKDVCVPAKGQIIWCSVGQFFYLGKCQDTILHCADNIISQTSCQCGEQHCQPGEYCVANVHGWKSCQLTQNSVCSDLTGSTHANGCICGVVSNCGQGSVCGMSQTGAAVCSPSSKCDENQNIFPDCRCLLGAIRLSADGTQAQCIRKENCQVPNQIPVQNHFTKISNGQCFIIPQDGKTYFVKLIDQQWHVVVECKPQSILDFSCVYNKFNNICQQGEKYTENDACICVDSINKLNFSCSDCFKNQYFIKKCLNQIPTCLQNAVQQLTSVCLPENGSTIWCDQNSYYYDGQCQNQAKQCDINVAASSSGCSCGLILCYQGQYCVQNAISVYSCLQHKQTDCKTVDGTVLQSSCVCGNVTDCSGMFTCYKSGQLPICILKICQEGQDVSTCTCTFGAVQLNQNKVSCVAKQLCQNPLQLSKFLELHQDQCYVQQDMPLYIQNINNIWYAAYQCELTNSLTQSCIYNNFSAICQKGSTFSQYGCKCSNSVEQLIFSCSQCSAGQYFIDFCYNNISTCYQDLTQPLKQICQIENSSMWCNKGDYFYDQQCQHEPFWCQINENITINTCACGSIVCYLGQVCVTNINAVPFCQSQQNDICNDTTGTVEVENCVCGAVSKCDIGNICKKSQDGISVCQASHYCKENQSVFPDCNCSFGAITIHDNIAICTKSQYCQKPISLSQNFAKLQQEGDCYIIPIYDVNDTKYFTKYVGNSWFVGKECISQLDQQLSASCIYSKFTKICQIGMKYNLDDSCSCLNSIDVLEFSCSNCNIGQYFIDYCMDKIPICFANPVIQLVQPCTQTNISLSWCEAGSYFYDDKCQKQAKQCELNIQILTGGCMCKQQICDIDQFCVLDAQQQSYCVDKKKQVCENTTGLTPAVGCVCGNTTNCDSGYTCNLVQGQEVCEELLCSDGQPIDFCTCKLPAVIFNASGALCVNTTNCTNQVSQNFPFKRMENNSCISYDHKYVVNIIDQVWYVGYHCVQSQILASTCFYSENKKICQKDMKYTNSDTCECQNSAQKLLFACSTCQIGQYFIGKCYNQIIYCQNTSVKLLQSICLENETSWCELSQYFYNGKCQNVPLSCQLNALNNLSCQCDKVICAANEVCITNINITYQCYSKQSIQCDVTDGKVAATNCICGHTLSCGNSYSCKLINMQPTCSPLLCSNGSDISNCQCSLSYILVVSQSEQKCVQSCGVSNIIPVNENGITIFDANKCFSIADFNKKNQIIYLNNQLVLGNTCADQSLLQGDCIYGDQLICQKNMLFKQGQCLCVSGYTVLQYSCFYQSNLICDSGVAYTYYYENQCLHNVKNCISGLHNKLTNYCGHNSTFCVKNQYFYGYSCQPCAFKERLVNNSCVPFLKSVIALINGMYYVQVPGFLQPENASTLESVITVQFTTSTTVFVSSFANANVFLAVNFSLADDRVTTTRAAKQAKSASAASGALLKALADGSVSEASISVQSAGGVLGAEAVPGSSIPKPSPAPKPLHPGIIAAIVIGAAAFLVLAVLLLLLSLHKCGAVRLQMFEKKAKPAPRTNMREVAA